MGLGKTVTTCSVLVAMPLRTLIIAPLALLEQWKAEIAKHTTGISAAVYRGSACGSLPDVAVTITNPESVVGDFKKNMQSSYETFERIVVDEAHVLRNAKSQLHKSMAAMMPRGARKLFLTGTPVCNKSADIISLVTLLNIPEYSDADFWATRKKEREAEALQHVRREYILRRTKEEILSDRLPKKEVRNIEIRLDESELYQKEYQRLRARQIKPVIAKILRLRQCVNQLSLVHKAMAADPATIADYGQDPKRLPCEMSGKVEYICDTIDTIMERSVDEKIVVFSQWTCMLECISEVVTAPWVMYHGKLGVTEKCEAIRRFREDPDTRVLLISLKSGGCGLNLTVANHVIITEPYFNAAEEKQAIDRVYRIGQTRDVTVHRLFVPNTVESWMYQLHKMKNTITNTVMTTADAAEGAEAIRTETVAKNTMFQALVTGVPAP
jgi:SNF2 family DNA or RNA helicase